MLDDRAKTVPRIPRWIRRALLRAVFAGARRAQ